MENGGMRLNKLKAVTVSRAPEAIGVDKETLER
jgi:hypothetical protein